MESIITYQEKLKELEEKLIKPDIIKETEKLQEISKEYSKMKEIVDKSRKIEVIDREIKEAQEIITKEKGGEILILAEEELKKLRLEKEKLEKEIEALFKKDKEEKNEIIVEIRAGVGGDEAEIFAKNLFRMYSKYAERKKWLTYIISQDRGSLSGSKEVIFGIKGMDVYENLKYESGVHRVQRIPTTEKTGRIHTSTASVAVLPKAEEVEVKINPRDLKIDTFLSSGKGGQSVQTTYSAVRITHLPSGIVISCQDERSQKQNKEKALMILRSRLLALEEEKKREEEAKTRKEQIKFAKRAEKIRTYNFPQDRVTDHRIKKSFHNIESIMNGDLDRIIEELKRLEAV